MSAIFLKIFISLIFTSIYFEYASAYTEVDCYKYQGCIGVAGSGTPTNGNPSYGNQIRLNPSAVPTEEGFGLEGILYRGEVDISLAKGTGRVGAAISPSNSEETFFGPPGIELDEDMYQRKYAADKFASNKVTLATAVNLIKKGGGGLRSGSLNLGIMGKYNKLTKSTLPGAGLTATFGPFNFSTASYKDETLLVYPDFYFLPNQTVKYNVKTYSWGLSLSSLLLDQSTLQLFFDDTDEKWTVHLTTISLMVKKMIITASKRREESTRAAYNFKTSQLDYLEVKEDVFGGLQIHATKNLMLGVLYNYYMLHETSITATIFL